MGVKAREVNANPQATSTSQPCGACPRRPSRVYEDQLWAWALEHPGEPAWRH